MSGCCSGSGVHGPLLGSYAASCVIWHMAPAPWATKSSHG
jgi:hypothetical protein